MAKSFKVKPSFTHLDTIYSFKSKIVEAAPITSLYQAWPGSGCNSFQIFSNFPRQIEFLPCSRRLKKLVSLIFEIQFRYKLKSRDLKNMRKTVLQSCLSNRFFKGVSFTKGPNRGLFSHTTHSLTTLKKKQ